MGANIFRNLTFSQKWQIGILQSPMLADSSKDQEYMTKTYQIDCY